MYIFFKFRTVRKDCEDIPREDVGLAARERGVLKKPCGTYKTGLIPQGPRIVFEGLFPWKAYYFR